ncbi:MFS transporter [Francisella tularensis]|uniref:MFS transporter n=1 Tax=Francisella tularensis TaxID=263 RepID=UPI00018552E9|nr:MFS transporter [Francisella tularensis]APC95144.1 sugar (and other) transporter family protein [Francisella tularensis subsp. novicida]AVC44056.1 MFS transporter [Francisella tularensis subsp. novicida]EDZ90576.1 transporter, major facilitator family [Francisella tularensis subsp. novicida FTG]MBK2335300.1 MFS transporter [Francisella tularensis subsp. novicida]MBK2346385.1 MFS transporter [Francisella tularensis subsp. novicida]
MYKDISPKNVIFAGLATSVEYFDFALFAYVTVFISAAFFPDSNSTVATIKTFGMFAAGYLMRPIGGIFFGNLGDKVGRKKVLIITVALMAISTAIIAFTPSYQQIGIVSVLLIIFARMIQGFSIGGEYNGVLAILSEQAPDNKRGLITAFGTFFSGFGVFLGTVVVFLFSSFLSESQMHSYGWRLCFVIGMIMAILVLILQFRQDESPEYLRAKHDNLLEDTPVVSAIREYPYQIFVVFALAGYLGIVYYMVSAFIPSLLEGSLHYSTNVAMLVTMVASICYFATAPLWGMISDKVGRKKVLLTACIGVGILIYPSLFIINSMNSPILSCIVMSLLMLLISAATATFVVAINELFPTHLRFSGVATGYNVSNALLGGTVPLVSSILIVYFGQMAPGIYAIIASVVIVAIIAKMPETRGIELEE